MSAPERVDRRRVGFCTRCNRRFPGAVHLLCALDLRTVALFRGCCNAPLVLTVLCLARIESFTQYTSASVLHYSSNCAQLTVTQHIIILLFLSFSFFQLAVFLETFLEIYLTTKISENSKFSIIFKNAEMSVISESAKVRKFSS